MAQVGLARGPAAIISEVWLMRCLNRDGSNPAEAPLQPYLSIANLSKHRQRLRALDRDPSRAEDGGGEEHAAEKRPAVQHDVA